MKKNIITTLVIMSLTTLAYSSTIMPSLSLRFNDVVNTNNDINDNGFTPTLVLGIAMQVEEGVTAGFDSDGVDSRLFVSMEYGTLGMGIDANGSPQFTIGAKYAALSNMDVALDYVINNLTADPDNNDEPFPNELRISLGVQF
jgi:hypothetical protein|tara:strand:- start:98 stop:526 length:429 start_codon:yes stop_codon:yes gene_type:complete